MDRHSANPARTGGPGHNGRAAGPAGRSAYLVTVLARALAAQVDELARTADPLPDGWWFAESTGPAATGAGSGVDGPYGSAAAPGPDGHTGHPAGYDTPAGHDTPAGYDRTAGYDGPGANR